MISISMISFLVSGYTSTLERRIIGGHESTNQPWMVYLNSFKKLCSGVLYTESLVLTAAHCNVYSNKKWKAYINVKRVEPVIWGGEKYAITKRFSHEKYVHDKYDYDISVWWINGKSNHFTQVMLDDGSELYDKTKEVNILGWGNQDRITDKQLQTQNFHTTLPAKLYGASLPLIYNKKCCSFNSEEFVPEIMFCMGRGRLGPATSFGDSGGPVYRLKQNKVILMGLISFGLTEIEGESYDVSVKISSIEISSFIQYFVPYFKPGHINKKGEPMIAIPSRI